MHVSFILKKHKVHSVNIFMKSLTEKLFTRDMCPFNVNAFITMLLHVTCVQFIVNTFITMFLI